MDDIERCVAESQIRNLIGRLAHLADGNDLDEYISLFTDEAVWEGSRSGARVGKEDILAGARQRRADGLQGAGSASRHIVTTQWVQVEDAHDATSQSYWMVLTDANATPVVLATGRYDDTLRFEKGAWKLACRKAVGDVN
jgi:3-phenylpropionate/cinnamic acid dioxygenase small subunit